MYLNILKKDLKRKKAMNIILLVFIILATMFVASSVNNIMSITTALDDYFDMAGVPDYFFANKGIEWNETEEILSGIDGVTKYGHEKVILVENNAFNHEGKEVEFKNTSVVMSFNDAKTKYFDMNNNEINDVKEGTVLLSGKAIANTDIKVGDTITVTIGKKSLELKVADGCKDAVLGSDLMGMTRFILNDKDFKQFYAERGDDVLHGMMWYINTTDTAALTTAVAEIDNVFFNGDKAMIKMAYVLDMIIAGVFLIISVCLILVAFVVLRFTISFTLSEEFREIGVMKAIGIKNGKIRLLYLVKYFAMAVTGAVIGCFISIPFSKMLLDNSSKTIVIRSENTLIINLLCSIAVVMIILLFSYLCTKKVKKFTPVDAIRNGQTGERFKRKSVFRLSKSVGKPYLFMALNDILSAPKRYLSVVFTYTLCMLIVLILVNTSNTLCSDRLITAFGTYKSDVYLGSNSDEIMKAIISGDRKEFEKVLDNVEEKLEKEGMPSKCTLEVYFKYNLTYKDKSFKSLTLYGINTTADMYYYHEGTAPQNKNEIAITPLVAEKLGATIGDTVTINHSFGNKEYIISGLYQSMNNLGEGVRLHEDADIEFSTVSGCFAIQADFTDDPDEKTVADRITKLKDIYSDENVMTPAEMVEGMVGVADAINAVKLLTLTLVIVIIALITVLMERSFIEKERGEIAVLKAIGFKTSTIVKWHSLRFVIIGIVSSVFAILLSTPVTSLAITPVFSMMGAAFGVEYEINLLEICVIYPAILLLATIISSVLTSLYTKKIKSSDTANIE